MHGFRAKALALLLLVGLTAAGQTRERSSIPDQYKWNLADIYASDDAWKAAKEDFVARMEKVGAYKGTIAESPAKMLAAAEAITNLNKEYGRLYVYAAMSADTDTRNSTAQAMKQEIGQLGSTFSAATAWLQPEILKMDAATIDQFLAAEPKLKPYRTSRPSVYTRLVDGVNQEPADVPPLPEAAQADDGLDELHYYDLYAPLVGVGESEATRRRRRRSTCSPRSRRSAPTIRR
jgi:oligoendopeptidase F